MKRSPKKILQIVKLYSPWIGGVEKAAQDFAEGIHNSQNVTDILCCQPKGQSKMEIINGAKVIRASSFGILRGMPVSVDFLFKFKKIFDKYDVLAIHQPFPLADLAIWLFRPKMRIVVHYHSDLVRQRILKYIVSPLAKNTLKNANKIIVSNPNLRDNSDFLHDFRKKCAVIPFGVDLGEITSLRNNKKINEYKNEYGKFALFVGRLNYYKGIEYLIDSMTDVSCSLVIVGSGDLGDVLKDKAKKLGVDGKVFFLGSISRKEIINLMAAAEVFVLPSIHKSEAFGIVLIEAMACGTPLISTELGTGTSWVNINNKTGIVVRPADSRALSAAINKIISDKKNRKMFSKNCLERINNFSNSRIISDVKRIYQAD